MPRKKKISPKDFAALNRKIAGIRYPADQGPAQIQGGKQSRAEKLTRLKKASEEEALMTQALDLWIESVERYNARAAAERRQQWIDSYRCMEQLHTKLAAEHREKAEALMEPPARGAHPRVEMGAGPT